MATLPRPSPRSNPSRLVTFVMTIVEAIAIGTPVPGHPLRADPKKPLPSSETGVPANSSTHHRTHTDDTSNG